MTVATRMTTELETEGAAAGLLLLGLRRLLGEQPAHYRTGCGITTGTRRKTPVRKQHARLNLLIVNSFLVERPRPYSAAGIQTQAAWRLFFSAPDSQSVLPARPGQSIYRWRERGAT